MHACSLGLTAHQWVVVKSLPSARKSASVLASRVRSNPWIREGYRRLRSALAAKGSPPNLASRIIRHAQWCRIHMRGLRSHRGAIADRLDVVLSDFLVAGKGTVSGSV